jgi:phosphonate transport system ATP-binding protein
MTADEPIFALRNVSKRFGDVAALTDINLTIWPGERVALVGPSGAGKSTLIGLLNGTLLPSEGEVRVLGHNVGQLSSRSRRHMQRQIGTIYQQFCLVDSLRVIHNVNAGHLGRWSLARALISLLWPLETQTAAQALARVGIPEKLYTRTSQLSGGQQQRVAVARVLVQNPLAILADEPISNIDPERSREVMDLLRNLSQSMGKTLVTSLHLVEFACSYFDRIVGLRAGRMFFDCSVHAVSPEMFTALYTLEEHPTTPTWNDREVHAAIG